MLCDLITRFKDRLPIYIRRRSIISSRVLAKVLFLAAFADGSALFDKYSHLYGLSSQVNRGVTLGDSMLQIGAEE